MWVRWLRILFLIILWTVGSPGNIHGAECKIVLLFPVPKSAVHSPRGSYCQGPEAPELFFCRPLRQTAFKIPLHNTHTEDLDLRLDLLSNYTPSSVHGNAYSVLQLHYIQPSEHVGTYKVAVECFMQCIRLPTDQDGGAKAMSSSHWLGWPLQGPIKHSWFKIVPKKCYIGSLP